MQSRVSFTSGKAKTHHFLFLCELNISLNAFKIFNNFCKYDDECVVQIAVHSLGGYWNSVVASFQYLQ